MHVYALCLRDNAGNEANTRVYKYNIISDKKSATSHGAVNSRKRIEVNNAAMHNGANSSKNV